MNVSDIFASPHQIRTALSQYCQNDYHDWCQENCQGRMVNYISKDEVVWFFEKETDAMLFALRWL